MTMPRQGLQHNRTGQRGAAAVEFALVSILFFTLLFGIIEFARFMYLLNTVQEITRKAAREAVVTDFTSAQQLDALQRAAIFQAGSSGTVGLPAGAEVTNLKVNIQYLNASMSPVTSLPSSPVDNIAACMDPARTDSCITFVQASVCQQASCDPVTYVPMVGLFTFLAIEIPRSTVIMPAESLGYRPS